jgi:hypothetical protein
MAATPLISLGSNRPVDEEYRGGLDPSKRNFDFELS